MSQLNHPILLLPFSAGQRLGSRDVALSVLLKGNHQYAVGYQGSEIKGGIFYMIAAPFDSVSGNGLGTPIKNLVTGEVPYGAEMQVRLPGGDYDIYHYIAEAYDESIDDFVPGWADGGDNLAVTKIAPGGAFWFKTDDDCNVTISGQVLADASKTVTVNSGIFSMIGNPYPADVNPNTIEWIGLTYGDEMQVRLDSGDYDIYHYIAEAYDESIDDFVPGWADGGDNLVVDNVLKAGRGAWIKPASAVSITWESPLK